MMVRRVAIWAAALLLLPSWPASAGPQPFRVEVPAPADATNHGAAIAELPSGALLACWFSGKHEEDRSVRILCSRGASDGGAWSPPWTAVAPGDRAAGAAAPNKSLGNVTLTVASDGRVWMIHGVIQSRPWPIVGETCTNWTCGRIDARVSADEGRTWRSATRLVDFPGALPRAGLKPVADGWIAPFYEENQQRTLIARLSLAGASAHLLGYWRLQGWKLIQPAMVVQTGGRLRLFFRDQQRRGVFTDVFDPATGDFTPPVQTNLPNPGSAVDAFDDERGRYVLIYNPSSVARDVLALARSSDGVHFELGCALSQPGLEAPAAYPSVIRGRDGDWRVVYSAGGKARIKFVRFSSGWLEDCFVHKG